MTVNQTRSLLYTLAKALGDYQAIKSGRVAQRVRRRLLGRLASRIIR